MIAIDNCFQNAGVYDQFEVKVKVISRSFGQNLTEKYRCTSYFHLKMLFNNRKQAMLYVKLFNMDSAFR